MPTIKQEAPSVMSSSGSAAKRPRVDPDSVKGMSSKQYLDEHVVPTMLRALSAVNKERPNDPIDFLIAYLSKEKERSASPSPLPASATPGPGGVVASSGSNSGANSGANSASSSAAPSLAGDTPTKTSPAVAAAATGATPTAAPAGATTPVAAAGGEK